MKFMKIDDKTALTEQSKIENLDDKWALDFEEIKNTNLNESITTKEIITTKSDGILSAVDEQNAVAGSWISEFTKNEPTNSQGEYNFLLNTIFFDLVNQKN